MRVRCLAICTAVVLVASSCSQDPLSSRTTDPDSAPVTTNVPSPSSGPPVTTESDGTVLWSTSTSTDVPTTSTSTPPTTTPYVVPVKDVDAAGWGETHSSYPATDIFLPCGAEIVSPVNAALLEVRRVDGWDQAVDNPATRGGRSISMLGDDGVRYYFAHFETIVEALMPGDRVGVGETLGTMGRTGRASACHLHFSISPPCPGKEWSVRRGVIWPYPYLDAWKRGDQLSPADEVGEWQLANPDACANAMADPNAPDS